VRFFTKRTSALVATASIMAMGRDCNVHRPGRAAATREGSSVSYLQLSNDKPSWTTGINAIGKSWPPGRRGWLAAQPYSSTTAFQGVVRAAATTSQARQCSHGGRASSWSHW